MAVKWYGGKVLAKLNLANEAMVDAAAFQIEAQTKVNIVGNGQVDTGFMLNSVYAITPKTDTYNPAVHLNLDREAAPAAAPPANGAVVGVAAEYAFYQEKRQSFLYAAAEQVAGQVGAIVEAGREVLND